MIEIITISIAFISGFCVGVVAFIIGGYAILKKQNKDLTNLT